MPRLYAKLEALRHNAAIVKKACDDAGASCLPVFKEAPLHPAIAKSIVEGGRLDSFGTLAWSDYDMGALAGIKLHHIYSPSDVTAPRIRDFDTVYVNSRYGLHILHEQCGNKRPRLRISLECGDERDGFHPEEIPTFCEEAVRLGFTISGLTLNFACLSSNAPSIDDLEEAGKVLEVVRCFAPEADISAGGTDILELSATTALPASVKEIRCGTGIMLGVYPLSNNPIPDARQDTFSLEGTVLECRVKGGRKRALFDFGHFQTHCESLIPPCPGMAFSGASSAYCAYDVTECEHDIREGQTLSFGLNFHSLASALISRTLPVELIP